MWITSNVFTSTWPDIDLGIFDPEFRLVDSDRRVVASTSAPEAVSTQEQKCSLRSVYSSSLKSPTMNEETIRDVGSSSYGIAPVHWEKRRKNRVAPHRKDEQPAQLLTSSLLVSDTESGFWSSV